MRSSRIHDANSCAWGGDIWHFFFGEKGVFLDVLVLKVDVATLKTDVE